MDHPECFRDKKRPAALSEDKRLKSQKRGTPEFQRPILSREKPCWGGDLVLSLASKKGLFHVRSNDFYSGIVDR